MLPLPYGTKHTLTLTANIWKSIRCQHCGCEFAFRKNVSVAGEGTNFLWLNRSGALASASAQAMENLERAIGNVGGNFQCPQCGMFQPDMASEIEREAAQSRRLAALGISLALMVAFASAVGGLLPANVGTLASIIAYSLAVLLAIAAGYWYSISRPPFAANTLAATRIGQAYSDEYPVLRRSDLENMIATQSGTSATPNIVLPWPTIPPSHQAKS
jgi:hypothetical protein